MPKGFAGSKANQAYTAFHHGEGVWGFGKDADIECTKALHDAKPTKRSERDREFTLFFIKIDFFYKLRTPLCRLHGKGCSLYLYEENFYAYHSLSGLCPVRS